MEIANMTKWKNRKQSARKNATKKKLVRGRQSGASDKENWQQQNDRDVGYAKIQNLLTFLVR